jgi:excisionase family DNA binding protein
MLSLLAFVAGIVILIKGSFRLLNRVVSKRDGRIIGLVLMAPFLLEIVLVFTLSFSMVSESMVVAEDGSVSISSDMFEKYVNQVSGYDNVFLLALGLALIAAGYLIWRSPQENVPNAPAQASAFKPPRPHPLGGTNNPFQAAPPKQAVAPPSIMTIAEAAAYIHVTPAEIDQMIDQGKLPAARSPGGFRIARSALDDMLAGTL